MRSLVAKAAGKYSHVPRTSRKSAWFAGEGHFPAASGLSPGAMTGVRHRNVRFARRTGPGRPGVRRTLRLRLGPVVADADVDGKRRVEVVCAAHFRAHELLHLRDLDLGYLE